MEEYQDHSLGSRVFQKIRDNILNGTYKENDELRETAIGERIRSEPDACTGRLFVSLSWKGLDDYSEQRSLCIGYIS